MSVTTLLPPPERPTERPAALSDPDHEEKRTKLLETFSDSSYKIPGIDNGELMEEERFWLSNECLLRYLRALKWDLKGAIQRLEDTLKWRRDFGMYSITPETVEPEAVTGKEIIFGYDVMGRPALYLIPSRQNTSESDRQVQFTFWALERCIDLMEPNVENITLLINFGDRAKNPSMAQSRKVLNILQSHYPERLGLALIINVPFLVTMFLNLIMPFVDPVTREKIKINPKVVEQGIIDADQVIKEWGGSVDFEYKHEEYWPQLIQTTKSRRGKWLDRWRSLGAKVGMSEWDYKEIDNEGAAVPEVL